MDRVQIYQLLKHNGATASMIASALKVTPSSVSEVINRGKGSRRIALAIAETCGKKIEEVFPHYKSAMTKQDKIDRQAELSKKLAKYA